MLARMLVGVALLAPVAVSLPATARAEAEDARTRAAAEFEVGVQLFARADHAAAARAFLRADAIVPSDDALGNALAAARKASDPLLVARAAQRAEQRDTSRELSARAREALAQVAPQLSRVRLSCKPMPCEIRIDDEVLSPGQQWVLPGTHRAVASSREARVEQDLRVDAGGSYAVLLRIPEAAPAKRPLAKPAGRGPDRPAPVVPKEPPRPLSPTVFYVGAAVTVALAAATTWSGLDTLAARDELPARPTTDQVEAVRGRVRRTDFLLGGTLLLGAATAYAGLAQVDWRAPAGAGAPPSSGTGALGLHWSGGF